MHCSLPDVGQISRQIPGRSQAAGARGVVLKLDWGFVVVEAVDKKHCLKINTI